MAALLNAECRTKLTVDADDYVGFRVTLTCFYADTIHDIAG